MSNDQSNATFDEWAVVDVTGHQRYVGRVTEQVIAGEGFVRVDVPKVGEQPKWSKIVGTKSIYSITPVSEAVAKAMAEKLMKSPVSVYDVPAGFMADLRRKLTVDGYEIDDDDLECAIEYVDYGTDD